MFFTANPRKRRRGRRGWWGESYEHAVAAKIGHGYRKYADDSRKFDRYLGSATRRGKHPGLMITTSSLRRYRRGRKLGEDRLMRRRLWFGETGRRKTVRPRTYSGALMLARRRWGTLVNPRASVYQQFIARHVSGARGAADARRRFRRAVRLWRAGSRRSKMHSSNPVLPIAYDNAVLPVAYNRRRRDRFGRFLPRRSPRRGSRVRKDLWSANTGLWRTTRGRYSSRYVPGARRLRRIPGGGWRTNAQVPVFPNRRRHYRTGRNWSSNPVLPYAAFNNPVEAITGTFEQLTNVDLWTGTILPLAGGYIGTHLVSYQAVKLIAPKDTKYEGIVKHGSRAAAAVLLSAGTGFILKDTDMAAKVLAGGLVALLGGIVEDLAGDAYKKALGLGDVSDLAQDLTEELKARIAAGVQQAVEGAGAGVAGGGGVSAFVTAQDLQAAPRLGDFMTQQALQEATVGTGLPGRPGGGAPLADLSTFQDAMADGSLI